MRILSDILIVAIPALISIGALLLGVRQVRKLRDLTGDNSIITAVLGFTIKPPRTRTAPAPKLPQPVSRGRRAA